MNLERWQRLKEVFATLLELPPEQRVARLAATLPDDPSLAAEVEDLFAAHDSTDDFYERGALAAVPEMRQKLEGVGPGMRLGHYRVLRELGRGGMGAVYLAERDEPGFSQQVAVKLVKRGMDTDEIVRRFRAERQILASLSHPNIARLLDGGSAPDGRPYFVMEYIEGRPITAFAEEHKLSVEARLHLFLKVAAAVQSAHQSLVVHRDLKPANILVDEAGDPKLLDFGIAKLLDPTGARTSLTGLRRGPMTPDYASPEQRAGAPITTATDVYGLGVLLYELLVGSNPQAVERRLGPGWAERPPSQAVRALAAPGDGDADKRRLARRLTGDLDTVVDKALAAEPERRYGTAAAFAEDVERHLTQRPVTARRPTLAYRLGRTVVRHKLAAALALGLVALAATALIYAWAWYEALHREEVLRRLAEASNTLLIDIIAAKAPGENRGEARRIHPVDTVAAELERNPPHEPEFRASGHELVGHEYDDLGSYDEARKHLKAALEIRIREMQQNKSKETALAVAADLTTLGSISYAQGNFPASLDFHRRAIEVKRSLLDSTALELAVDWNGQGQALLEQEKIDEAARDFAWALRISRLADGAGHGDLAATFNNLGTLALRKRLYPRARLFFSAALRYYQSNKDDDPDTLVIRRNLAYSLSGTGDYAGAEAMDQEIVTVYRRLVERSHPDLSTALLQLAIVQRQSGHLAGAQATLGEVWEIRRVYHFPRDQAEAESWNLQGAIALDRNQVDEAEKDYAKSYEHYVSLAGEQRGNLASVLNSLVQVRQRRGDLKGAMSLARRRLELARAVRSGPLDEAVARAEVQLGSCYLAMGDTTRARSFLEEGHRTLLALLGPGDSNTVNAASQLHRLESLAGSPRESR